MGDALNEPLLANILYRLDDRLQKHDGSICKSFEDRYDAGKANFTAKMKAFFDASVAQVTDHEALMAQQLQARSSAGQTKQYAV